MSELEYVYGYHAIKALLTTQPENVQELLLQTGREDEKLSEISALAKKENKRISRVNRKDLEKLVGANLSHQGVVAKCHAFKGFDESALPSFLSDETGSTLLLILDGVQDPHNLGACLRSANAFGVNVVIAPKDRAVGITPVVRKVACGAASVTPFIAVTNLARTLRWLQEQGVWLVGTEAQAESNLAEIDLTGNIAIVMGSEGQGMRRLTRKHCDFLANIPMCGSVASLNVSVATAICLYEVSRQRSH